MNAAKLEMVRSLLMQGNKFGSWALLDSCGVFGDLRSVVWC
jgi:hypothetical protein